MFTDQTCQQNTSLAASPYLWEQPLHTLPSPDSCDTADSTLPSPTAIVHPNLYTLPNDEFDQDIKEDTPFDIGSFDDWLGWDDPADKALSPTTTDFFPELKMEPTSPNMQQLELQGGGRSQYQNLSMVNGIEDAAAVFGDAQMDQPLFQTADQPRGNLYSTPPSWSPPSSNIKTETYPLAPPLTPRQQSRLIAQAMPSRARAYPSSRSSTESPEPEQFNGLKRKSTSCASDEEDEDFQSPQPTSNGNRRHPPVKKTAHNMIEKRYRTNLNDKIAALRDSVPSLRVATNANSRGEEAMEDLQGLTPAHKLNKVRLCHRLPKISIYLGSVQISLPITR
jgi:hypothetical protein